MPMPEHLNQHIACSGRMYTVARSGCSELVSLAFVVAVQAAVAAVVVELVVPGAGAGAQVQTQIGAGVLA